MTYSYQKLGMISRIFYHCSPDIKEKLYNHLVRSKLEYCCTVWDPNQICLIRSIERIQKKASKIVLGRCIDNYGQAMTDMKWSRLHDRRYGRGSKQKFSLLFGDFYSILHLVLLLFINNF